MVSAKEFTLEKKIKKKYIYIRRIANCRKCKFQGEKNNHVILQKKIIILVWVSYCNYFMALVNRT